jgi:endo-1,4-beta-mannosidase
MARKHYKEDEVLRSLSKKHDVKIDGYTIYVLNGKSKRQPMSHDLGNGSWGKIDYLVNYCGYSQYYINEFL